MPKDRGDSYEQRSQERELYASSDDYIRAKVRGRRRRTLIIMSVCLAAAAGVIYFLLTYYRITKVYVEGNTRYTNEQISERVMDGPLGDNMLVLSVKYRFKEMPSFPFVERMDLERMGNDTIRIKVYEKALAGYIAHLGSYIYFDRNGTVVETSAQRIAEIPEIVGLEFSYIVLYEKLPVKNEAIFARILNMTQLLRKYGLQADKIYFDSRENMSIYFGDVRADLGQDVYSDEKISNLSRILPELADRKGVLEMENFTPESKSVTFRNKTD